jgi:hypothetical protein
MSDATAKAFVGRLRADLETGGPVFGPMLDADRWGVSMRPLVGGFADESLATTVAAATDQDLTPEERAARIGDIDYRWVAALQNTCTTCLARHGQTDIFSNWVARGLPPVHQRCACRLVPFGLPGFDATAFGDFTAPLSALARTAVLDGQRLDGGVTYRVPADLLERERAGRDVRVNAETGEVRDARLDRILASSRGRTAEAAATRRALRLLGRANAGAQPVEEGAP